MPLSRSSMGHRLAVALVGWCVLSSGYALGQEKNLVVNGGFEIDSNHDGVPDAWGTSGGRTVVQKLDLDEGRTGGRCARLTCTKFAHGPAAPHAMLCQVGKVAVERGKWYRLTLWAKQTGLATGVAAVALRDTKGWHDCGLNQMIALPMDTTDWRQFTFHFQAVRSCSTTSRLQLWHQETGTLWVDDVELTLSSRSVHRPGDVVPTEGCKNLVPNSSFECGEDRWGSLTLTPLTWGGGLDGLVGEVDTSQASHGKASMKIALTPRTTPVYHFDYFDIANVKIKDPSLGGVGWVRVKKDKDYTLSAYLKSRQPGLTARLGLCQFPWREATQAVTVSPSWRRYSIAIKPRSDYCFVMVGPDLNACGRDDGTLWVHAVQLEEGASATAYEPSKGVEMGLVTHKVGNVFAQGEPVAVTVLVHNSTAEAQRVTCDLRVLDFFDREVKHTRLEHTVDARSTRRERVDLGLAGAGFFWARAAMQWSGGQAGKAMRLAVIPAYESKDSKFGVNHAYGMPRILRLCKAAGLTWFRDWSLKWKDIEPEKGRFDFSRTDAEIDRILAEDVNVLGLLPFPSAPWSSAAPAQVAGKGGYQEQRQQIAYAARDESEFREYVKRTVQHYRGRIAHWQIFNEPLTTHYSLPRSAGYSSSDYARWVKVASQAAKEADPKCKVLIGFAGLSSRAVKEFEGIFEAGALDHCDALTVHRYPRVAPPEHIEEPLQALNKLMDRYGKRKPIWMTEHGYYCDDDPAVVPHRFGSHATPLPDERTQAAYSARFNVMLLANGVEKIFYHSGRCTRLNRDNIEGIFFEYGGAPRRIYAAVAAQAKMLCPDAEFVRQLALGDGIRAYLFRRGDRLVLAAWRFRAGARQRLILGHPGLHAHDLMSNPLDTRAVELTSAPVYVVSSGLTDAQLEAGLSVAR